MRLVELLAVNGDRLTPAERRIADVVVTDPELVAFGTVADIATRSRTSGASVVRFGGKIGLDGFSGLQELVRDELSQRLRPAVERIREGVADDLPARALAVEVENVAATLRAVDPDELDAAARRLALAPGRVWVLPGQLSQGAGQVLAEQLQLLRPDVALAGGGALAATRMLVDAGPGDVAVAVDFRRYERWLLRVVARLRELGTTVVAVSDSVVSPLGRQADHAFAVRAEGAGPFDSHVGTVALGNLLAAGVAKHLQSSATARLDAVEAAWRAGGWLRDA